MAVVRVNKTKNYTVMSNYHLREKNMSLKAKGLLSQMLSLPDDWNYTIAGLIAINKENETSINSALNELKQFGYLVVTKRYPNETESGRIEYVYDVYEQPVEQARQEQHIEKQAPENQPLENQGQLNNNISNTEVLNTKDNINSRFEALWALYPRKQGKAQAFKSYQKAVKNGVSDDTIKTGIIRYAEYVQRYRVDPKYVKHGSTWFNGQCWEDEYGKRQSDLDSIF